MEKEELYDTIMSRLPNQGFDELDYLKEEDTQIWTSKKGLMAYHGGKIAYEKRFSSVTLEGTSLDARVEICNVRGTYSEGLPLSGTASHLNVHKISFLKNSPVYEHPEAIKQSGIRTYDSCRVLELFGRTTSGSFTWYCGQDKWEYVLDRLMNELNRKLT